MSSKIETEPKSNTENTLKRKDEEVSINKRPKSETGETENIEAMKTKNFIKACEQVSYSAYLNYAKRFELVYLPTCVYINNCNHNDRNHEINSIPSHMEQSFNIEIKSNMWHDALEVCFLSLTPNRYLTANVLRNITEIMLNVHEDPDADFTTSYLIEKCQEMLSQSFSTHPPCHMKTIRRCYHDFLISSMDKKKHTFTNRSQYGYENGIVKYCMNRLEYEISLESKDEPLVNMSENVPKEMKQSIKGLHWQKKKCEIYETLDRNVRIERLFAVLDSVVELIQFDLAIWHARCNNNTGSQITRSQRPLMAFILWSENITSTGTVNNNCKQILKIFAHLVHLQYPVEYLRIITTWLNCTAQTFYMFENNSTIDYPNTGKYCNSFAKEFYNTIKVLPQESINRILKNVHPTFMQHLIGCFHIQSILSTKEDDIIQVIIDFLKSSQWERLQETEKCNETLISRDNWRNENGIKNVPNNLSKVIEKIVKRSDFMSINHEHYPKYDSNVIKHSETKDQSYVISTLYITLTAFLDAFNVKDIQDTLGTLNEQLLTIEHMENDENWTPEYCKYTLTEFFIRKYRDIYEMLKDLMLSIHELKSDKKFPKLLNIFENISLLRR